MSQRHLETPEDLLQFQLRTAMTMEQDSLAALEELAGAARSNDVKKLFKHHMQETKEQISNLEKVFGILELKESTAPSPSTKGISRQAHSLIERAADELHDQVVLSAALGNEHYEISAYECLILPVRTMGVNDAASLLTANLEQEQHTSEELKQMLEKIVSKRLAMA